MDVSLFCLTCFERESVIYFLFWFDLCRPRECWRFYQSFESVQPHSNSHKKSSSGSHLHTVFMDCMDSQPACMALWTKTKNPHDYVGAAAKVYPDPMSRRSIIPSVFKPEIFILYCLLHHVKADLKLLKDNSLFFLKISIFYHL